MFSFSYFSPAAAPNADDSVMMKPSAVVARSSFATTAEPHKMDERELSRDLTASTEEMSHSSTGSLDQITSASNDDHDHDDLDINNYNSEYHHEGQLECYPTPIPLLVETSSASFYLKSFYHNADNKPRRRVRFVGSSSSTSSSNNTSHDETTDVSSISSSSSMSVQSFGEENDNAEQEMVCRMGIRPTQIHYIPRVNDPTLWWTAEESSANLQDCARVVQYHQNLREGGDDAHCSNIKALFLPARTATQVCHTVTNILTFAWLSELVNEEEEEDNGGYEEELVAAFLDDEAAAAQSEEVLDDVYQFRLDELKQRYPIIAQELRQDDDTESFADEEEEFEEALLVAEDDYVQNDFLCGGIRGLEQHVVGSCKAYVRRHVQAVLWAQRHDVSENDQAISGAASETSGHGKDLAYRMALLDAQEARVIMMGSL